MAINRLNKDFSYELSISASAQTYYDFENDTTTDQYAPFKNMTILNTGTVGLKVYTNSSSGYRLVPAGTILSLEDQDITYLRIVNVSGTTTANATLQLNNDLSQKELLKTLVNLVSTNGVL
jgi:hypothetical protein